MTTDPFAFIVAQLLGRPVPPLPDTPGRVIKAPRVTDADPGLVQFEHAGIWLDLVRELARDSTPSGHLRISKPQAPTMRTASNPEEVGAQ